MISVQFDLTVYIGGCTHTWLTLALLQSGKYKDVITGPILYNLESSTNWHHSKETRESINDISTR